MSRNSQILNAVLRELDAHGIDYEIEQCRHLKIRFTANGLPHTVVVSRSPSDGFAHKNAVRDVRRILRGGHL